jgi:hypothetical protein
LLRDERADVVEVDAETQEVAMRYDLDERDEDLDDLRSHHRGYNCGGWASFDGPCGALDCVSCHPEGMGEDEEREEESTPKVRTVTARKARYVGKPNEIRPGDRVRETSWYTYIVGGARTGYFHEYKRLAKGPAWTPVAVAA